MEVAQCYFNKGKFMIFLIGYALYSFEKYE